MAGKDHLVEQAIRQAIEEGKFDNLAGSGKPLDLKSNPYVDAGWAAAFDLLSKQGFALAWMEKRNSIEEELTQARQALARTWTWQGKQPNTGEDAYWTDQAWKTAQNKFRAVVEDLNRRIDDYNLEVPADAFMRLRIDADREIVKVQAESQS